MKSEKRKLRISRTCCYIVLILLAFLSLFPFFILIINATQLHGEIIKGFRAIPGNNFLRNLHTLFDDKNIPTVRALLNSVYISACTAILSPYFSAMTAYGIFMYRFKGRKFAFHFIMLVMMVPTQVSALGFLRLIARMGLMDTFFPLIVPSIAAPIVFFFMLQYMESALPAEIVEAARVDGSNEIRTFHTIILPILKPALAVQAIFSFVNAWNNFFLPTLIINSNRKKTVPIIIAQLRNADYMKFDLGKVYILICVAILPLLIIYLFLSRFIISGVTLGSVKG